ncbi:unnamed protein product [Cercopithifilaria johnstoni]|uniref:Uncharacterized protein n=1 Tax=Cercopithifilaria johnstoni TaxID=2874296 RepID=A0A8J2QAZ3_9BILA|nr:unnamed protein product [Cercopithifilaria johnstoni]
MSSGCLSLGIEWERVRDERAIPFGLIAIDEKSSRNGRLVDSEMTIHRIRWGESCNKFDYPRNRYVFVSQTA